MPLAVAPVRNAEIGVSARCYATANQQAGPVAGARRKKAQKAVDDPGRQPNQNERVWPHTAPVSSRLHSPVHPPFNRPSTSCQLPPHCPPNNTKTIAERRPRFTRSPAHIICLERSKFASTRHAPPGRLLAIMALSASASSYASAWLGNTARTVAAHARRDIVSRDKPIDTPTVIGTTVGIVR